MAEMGDVAVRIKADTSELEKTMRKLTRPRWNAIEGMLFICMIALVMLVVIQIGGIFHPVTWTTHIGGHECAVMRTGFSRSISCNWSNP